MSEPTVSPRFAVSPPFAVVIAALSSCVALACSGPDLNPQAAPNLPRPDEVPEPVIPTGGYCGRDRIPSEPLDMPGMPLDGVTGATDCTGLPDAPGVGHTPTAPLGLGYPPGYAQEPIPPHVAYLTFDDGPSEWTSQFLDILQDKSVKATFFITAQQLKGPQGLDASFVDDGGKTVVFRDLLKREVDEGHVIANHTVNHPDLGRITPSQITSEIEQNELLVNRALLRVGEKPHVLSLFRPPYGSPWDTGIVDPVVSMISPLPSQRVSSHGLNILWNLSSEDSSEWALDEAYSRGAQPQRDADAPTYAEKMARTVKNVLQSAQVTSGAGFVVLMHDTHDTTRDVLAQIIDGLNDAGYSFQTIEDYVQWRWNRPSIDMTPGPNLYQRCVAEKDWGCVAVGVPLGTDRTKEICGRMWLAYESLGGYEELGAPLDAPAQSDETGIISQSFESATIELHPENAAPCNAIAIPR